MQDFARLPVTASLIAANVLVYLAVSALAASAGVPWNIALVNQIGEVINDGALVPEAVAQGQAWRLLTSIFLHSGLVHLAFNMVALYFLGTFAESAFGRWRFFALYVLSGLSGGLAYLYFGGFSEPAVGASGAIFGLLGSILGYALRRGTFSWQNPVIRQLLILLAINVYLGVSIDNISNTAHMGGLAGGFAFGWLMAPTVYSQKKLRALTPVALVLGAELVLLALWFFL
ncbi:MAG: rhomboid family intramembrane serine protease [Actinomycetota bacterium]|nr:rhomboid family intramembrane serine protease [Actinomycetota bacterium]HZY66041.1 rhomboid family intramembrane serine protease [Rubrobacteraceae bacterium]